MSKTIDFAKAHFSAKDRLAIEVPEWKADGTEGPLVIHASPITLAERQKIDNYRERWGSMEGLAYTLILKAEDGDGKKLFTLDDKRTLMTQVDPEVLGRVVFEILRPTPAADLEKN